jgi:hypothetical protein
MTDAVVDDLHVFDLPAAELRPRVASALRRSFGGEVEELEPGRWRARTTRRGIAHTITVRVDERERQSVAHVDLESRRPPLTLAALVSLTALTVTAWVTTALLTFVDFRGSSEDAARIAAWVTGLVASLGLTAYLRHYAASRHPSAIGALAPLERFWHELEVVEAAPRLGRGYRIAPEIADAAPTSADAAVDAEAEAAAAEAAAADQRIRG